MNKPELPTPHEVEGDVGRGERATLEAELAKIAAETNATGLSPSQTEPTSAVPTAEEAREVQGPTNPAEGQPEEQSPQADAEVRGVSEAVIAARQELVQFADQSNRQARNLESVISGTMPDILELSRSNPDLGPVFQSLYSAQGEAQALMQGVARNSGEYTALNDEATIATIRATIERNMAEMAQKAVYAVNMLANARDGRQLRLAPDRAAAVDQNLENLVLQVRTWYARMYANR